MKDKTKISIFNALSALVYMAASSILGLIFNHEIISVFGSDYNGVNATITQIINAIMILEGGFLLASTVALFKPLKANDTFVINGILSATKSRFTKVGLLALVIGLPISGIYPLFLSTKMPYLVVVVLMLFALIPACFNLGVSQKYRAVLLAEQKEYIVNIISTITYIGGVAAALILIKISRNIILARFAIMISLLVNYSTINIYCKKKYRYVDFSIEPMFDKIKGTGDVIILKVSSIVYTAMPIVAISMIPSGGTLQASVYAVYKSIINIIKGCLSAVTNAPRLSFGALLADQDERRTKLIFQKYEQLTCMMVSVFLGTTCLLILPFVSLYTGDISDAMYRDKLLAMIMLVTIFFEIVHIPSGQIIQMAGSFGVAKKIQLIACVVQFFSTIVGGAFFQIYGIVLAVLMAAVFLAIFEIGYVAKVICPRSVKELLKNIAPSAVICTCATLIGFSDIMLLNSYIEFISTGCIAVLILSLVTVCVYYFVDRDNTECLIRKGTTLIKKCFTRT